MKREQRPHHVLVVHGHDDEAKESLARFLQQIGLSPVILHEQPSLGRTIIEKFERYSDVEFAVILLTGDDVGGPAGSPEQAYRARQNVVFEMGYCIGKIGRTRVCALLEKGVELPSDVGGVVYVEYDKLGAWRLDLAKEIKAAGIAMDLNKVLEGG